MNIYCIIVSYYERQIYIFRPKASQLWEYNLQNWLRWKNTHQEEIHPNNCFFFIILFLCDSIRIYISCTELFHLILPSQYNDLKEADSRRRGEKMKAIHQDDVPTLFTLMKNIHNKRMYQRYQAVYLFTQDYPNTFRKAIL